MHDKLQPAREYCSPEKEIRSINPAFEDFEVKELILYPAVEERLRKLKVDYITGYKPERIPAEQI